MKYIKRFSLFEAVPQDGFHNRFFKDPRPGVTNFTQIAVMTFPIDGNDLLNRPKGEPGSNSNPSVEELKLTEPFVFDKGYSTRSRFIGREGKTVDKLYIYKIHYQSERYPDGEMPTGLEPASFAGGRIGYWSIIYDNDAGQIFSPSPLSDEKSKMPKSVYEYFLNYGGDASADVVGLSEVRVKQTWRWDQNIHNTATIVFSVDGAVDYIEIQDSNTSPISLPNWVGKDISDEAIIQFFADTYPDYHKH